MSISEMIYGGSVMAAFADEKITVNTAVGFTTATYAPTPGNPAFRALVTVETDQVRFRYEGTDPTSSVGHLLDPGDRIVIEGYDNIKNARFIKITNNATLQVTYERFA